MKKFVVCIYAVFCLVNNVWAQQTPDLHKQSLGKLKGYGVTVAYQQGISSYFEAGIERYWEDFTLLSPRKTAVSAGLAYNPFQNIGGVHTNLWSRKGRLSYTYGASAAYYNDFKDHHKLAFGPTFGYRLLGLHLTIGYNIRIGNNDIQNVNSFYGAARIYIPVKRNFKMDEKLKNRQKEKDKREANSGAPQQWF